MAFTRKTWYGVGGNPKAGSAPSFWLYKSSDTQATINSSGYFDDVADSVAVGDLIYCTTGAAAFHTFVLTNAAGVVDVADGDALTATDTD